MHRHYICTSCLQRDHSSMLALQSPRPPFSCTRGDYVRLYLDLESATGGDYNDPKSRIWPEITSKTPWSRILCSRNHSMLPDSQMVHYSSGRSLILEFHSDDINSNHSGFSGAFADMTNNVVVLKLANLLSLALLVSWYLGLCIGTYRFLNQSDFEQTGGEPLSGTPCDYEFL